jgi:membrane-bound ClpP family serine protease
MLPMMLLMAFPLLGLVLLFVLPPGLAIPLYLLGLILSGVTHWAMMRSMRIPLRTGPEGMIGARGRVLSWQQAGGFVSCQGEAWRARCLTDAPLIPGTEVEV